LKLYLKYPKKIFPREKEGLECVHKFSKKNVEKKYDIVLQNQGYNLANIFKKKLNLKNIKIENNSVGVIPNSRVVERVNSEEIYSIYKLIIKKLINAKKSVYILRHSYEDLVVCEKIKKFFSNNKNVILISDDLNAIELENIIKQFDFVIASRYHSIIHSYKNEVPALVIGWATKYFELLKDFDQLDYFFDCRNNINIGEIDNKLDNMIKNYKNEKKKILHKMNSMQKENIFDILL
jgi:colanic acid/amylovoran biosynthesis protein